MMRLTSQPYWQDPIYSMVFHNTDTLITGEPSSDRPSAAPRGGAPRGSTKHLDPHRMARRIPIRFWQQIIEAIQCGDFDVSVFL